MNAARDPLRPPKDIWDIIQTLAIATGAAALPIVIAVIGNSFSASTKEKEIRLKTVEIAINVLSQDPKTNASLPQLREWAITVIDTYSGIPLSAAARAELLKNALPTTDASRVSDLLTHGGGVGGFFIESSVDNYKFMDGSIDIAFGVKRASARQPAISPPGTQIFTVIIDGKAHSVTVPLSVGKVTKIVIERGKVYTVGPLPPIEFLKN